MADNFTLSSSVKATFATDDVGGVHYEIVKLAWGALDAANLVSAADPMPVTGDLSLTGSNSVFISNVPTVSLSGSTSAVVRGAVTITGSHSVIISNVPTVSISGSTSAVVRGAVTITGSHSVVVTSGTVTANAGTGDFLSVFGHTRNELFKESAAVGGELDDTTPVAATEGNVSPARITAQRAFHVNPRNNAGTEIGTASDPIRIDPTGTTIQPVTITGSLSVFVSGLVSLTGSNSVFISNVPTVSISGSTSAVVRGAVTITGSSSVFISNVPTVSISGSTSAVVRGAVTITGSSSVFISNTINAEIVGDVTLTGSMSVFISNVPTVSISGSTSAIVQGAAAHGASVSGNPLLFGLEARTSNPTAVTNGQAVRAMADDMGRQVISPNAARDLVVVNSNESLTVSTTLTLIGAGGAGVFRDLLAVTVSNPTATDSLITIYDGLVTGTQRFRWELAANGGGVVMVFNTPFPQGTANNGWAITSSEVGCAFTVQAMDTV